MNFYSQTLEYELESNQNGINNIDQTSKTIDDDNEFSNQFINLPIDIKDPSETVQEYLFTEEKLEMQGKDLNNMEILWLKYTNIKMLDLTNCRIAQIPQSITDMTNLQKLILSNNQITDLSIDLEKLIQLQMLDLSYNKIHLFTRNLKNLRQLNLSYNYLETPYLGLIEVLCIQMNQISFLPQEFLLSITNMLQLEFEWFQYCQPNLPLKLNFQEYPQIHNKLKQALYYRNLYFKDFLELLSSEEIDLAENDFKNRNLYFQAGLNDEIGILYQLNKISNIEVNQLDCHRTTALSYCYIENQMRSVNVLQQIGGKFSQNAIHHISKRVDTQNLKYFLQNHINKERLEIEKNLMCRNEEGNTPMHELMINFDKYSTSAEFGYILLQYDIDPNIENNEGCTPLQMAIKKQQLEAIKFAYEFNQSENATDAKFFDFNHQSKMNGHSICHIAVMVGNYRILQYLLEINADFFSVTKTNKVPKFFATQGQSRVIFYKSIEKRWLYKNIISECPKHEQELNGSFEAQNVQQMKNQIEKNSLNSNFNSLQKYFEQEDINVNYSLDSYNEYSLQVGSECLVRDAAAQSIPLYFRSNQQNSREIEEVKEMADYQAEAMKLLRNGNIESAINKFKSALNNQNLSMSEKVKYKNQLTILKFRFKQKKIDLKVQLGKDIGIVLSQYQFSTLKSDRRKRYFKEISQLIIEENKSQLMKAENLVKSQRIICSSCNLNKDLKITGFLQVADFRNLICKNLAYDLTNYAYLLSQSQDQIYDTLYSCILKTEKILTPTTFFNLQNYEYLQQMKFKRCRVLMRKYDDIEKDMQEHYSLPNDQIIINSNLFCNSKRF